MGQFPSLSVEEVPILLAPYVREPGAVHHVLFGGFGQCAIVYTDGTQVLVPGNYDWTRETMAEAKRFLAPVGAPPGPPPLGPVPAWARQRAGRDDAEDDRDKEQVHEANKN